IWQLSLFRNVITPWYTGVAALFWIGLVGMIYTLFTITPIATAHTAPPVAALSHGVAVMTVIVIAASYIRTNRTYDDKVYHLYSRSPASAACLYQQRNAPTFCEYRLFQWEVQSAGPVYALADRLKRQSLSVFAPNQRWTLQGDFGFDTVQIQEAPGAAYPVAAHIAWVEDGTGVFRPWYDYRHLNL